MFEHGTHQAYVTGTGEILLPGAKVRIHSIYREPFLKRKCKKIISGIGAAVLEWKSIFISGLQGVVQPFIAIKNVLCSVGGFFSQPIMVLLPKKKAKKTTRGWLFITDSARFTASFAFMFGILFIGLNYQSFWEIVSDELQPIRGIQNVAENRVALNQTLSFEPKGSLQAVGTAEGSALADFLPTVGPPEDRVLIPKLNLNVPLVQPEVQALLKQDWVGVEKDIQSALEKGVVHYPGTAKPGQAGNFFVTGHSSYYPWADGKYKTVFARLHSLDVGDEYFVYYHGDQHKYIVQSKTEVSPDNTEVLNQPSNKRISTLMTCTPVGTTLRRLIIVAQEVDPVTNVALQVGENQKDNFVKVNTDMLPI